VQIRVSASALDRPRVRQNTIMLVLALIIDNITMVFTARLTELMVMVQAFHARV